MYFFKGSAPSEEGLLYSSGMLGFSVARNRFHCIIAHVSSLQHINMYTGDSVFYLKGDQGTGDLGSRFECVKGNNARSISFDICTKDDRDNVPIVLTGSESNFEAFQIMCNKGIIGVTSCGTDYSNSIGKKINDGEWHRVVVTYDGTSLRIFVDFLPDNESKTWNDGTLMADKMDTKGNIIYLGKSLWTYPNNPLVGKLRNVRFYNIEVSNIKIRR